MHQLGILGPIWIQIGPTATTVPYPRLELKFINKKQGQQTVGSIVRDFDDKKHTEKADLFWNRDTPQLHSPDL